MDYIKMAESIALCGKSHGINKCKSGCIYYSGDDMNKCIPKMTADCADAILKLYFENQALRCGISPIQLDEGSARAMELAIEVSDLSQQLKEAEKRAQMLSKKVNAVTTYMRSKFGWCVGCNHSLGVHGCDRGNMRDCNKNHDHYEFDKKED